jgi:hypothetical protein
MLPLIDDNYANKPIRVSARAISRVTVVVLIWSLALHQDGFVDPGLTVERQHRFARRIGNPFRRMGPAWIPHLIFRDYMDMSINDHSSNHSRLLAGGGVVVYRVGNHRIESRTLTQPVQTDGIVGNHLVFVLQRNPFELRFNYFH